MDLTVTALKNNEEEIVRGFSGDPKDFIRECTEIGIYSREIGSSIKKSFEALDLDSNVPRDVSIRFLLVHAYDGLQGNQRLFQPFLKVLAKYGVPDHVLLSCKACATQRSSSPVFMETMSLAEGIGDVLSAGSASDGIKRPQNRYFQERHISALTEILAGHSVSSKWENIGVFLRLPTDTLKYISTLIHTKDLKMCLKDVLEEWIVRQHEHAKPPTVENLKAALRSQTVNFGKVASQLDDDLAKHGVYFNDEDLSSIAERPHQDTSLLDIVSSVDTLVQEDKSTLLEVQVEARHGTNISYQWLKDGLPLKEGEDFVGVNKPILCINNSCISKSNGAYICKITSEDDLPGVYSNHINVSVCAPPLDNVLVKVLVDRYCAQPEIPEDSWPPRGGNTYINLALIKQGSIEKAGEYARNTIQGDMDDIFANKDSIEYEDVFTNLESGTRLLIEGRPGSGKTTLVHKFSKDWGRGKLQFNIIRLVFLVHLRGFFNNPNIMLRDIVQQYYMQESKHMVDEVIKYSEIHNGEGLCFVLDGLDEYRPDSKNKTFIFQLIKRQLLPKSIVIVASRPAATAKLRSIATRQVEVIGFLKQQIDDYIEEYSFSNFCKQEDLQKYLQQHPNVRHMCYLPIHAAMVCYLFDVMRSKLPRTETKMYTEFTNHTLLRTLTRYNEDTYLQSPDELSDQDKEIFYKICKLAFEKTVASRQVLKKSEIPHFSDISSGSESMGLITVDEMASVCGFENLYTFLHLTFQEYLAAYHISKLEEENQLKVIIQYSQKKHMIVVWKFYCGLVNFNEHDDRLKNILSFKDDLFNVHCAFESQQSVTCDSVVMTGESGTLTFKNHFLTPSDSTAIGYVVKNAEFPVEKVVLDRCTLSQEGVHALIDKAGDKISSLKALSFHGKGCLMGQFQLLNTCLRAMVSIEVLDISSTNLGAKKVQVLIENLTLPNLQTLKLSSFMLDHSKYLLQSLVFNSPIFRQVLLVDGGLPRHQGLIIDSFGFSPFLHGCGSLAHVNIQDHLFEPGDFNVLSSSINQFSCCTNLCLTNCNIGDDIGALKNLALLESFDVSVNGIRDRGVTVVAENIKNWTKLQNLNMSFNHIGDSGAMTLAESLHILVNLKKLDLSYNRIGDEGAIAVTRAIKDFQDFELLLWNHRITKEGVGTVTDLKPDVYDIVIPDENPRTISSATYLKREASKGLTCLLTVDSKTIEQTYPWDAAGFQLYLPKGPLPDKVNRKTIKLEATISGNYHFPPNTKPVSAIYSITTDLSIEATFELEHCYSGNHQDLAFVYCQSHQPPFNFVFAAKEDHTFSFSDTHGVIQTRGHMPSHSLWTIVYRYVWKLFAKITGKSVDDYNDDDDNDDDSNNSDKDHDSDSGDPMIASHDKLKIKIMHFHKVNSSVQQCNINVNLVILRELSILTTEVQRAYSGWRPCSMPIRNIEFSKGSDKVRVDLTSFWTDIDHNWWVRPETNPEIPRSSIEESSYGSISLQYKQNPCTGQGLDHQVILEGLACVGNLVFVNLLINPDTQYQQRHINPDSRPTMPNMIFEERDGTRVNIAERIGDKYPDFGAEILDDRDGSIVSNISFEQQRNCTRINQAILRDWIRQRQGAKPLTWRALIQVLRSIGLNNLATKIEEKYVHY